MALGSNGEGGGISGGINGGIIISSVSGSVSGGMLMAAGERLAMAAMAGVMAGMWPQTPGGVSVNMWQWRNEQLWRRNVISATISAPAVSVIKQWQWRYGMAYRNVTCVWRDIGEAMAKKHL